MTPIRLILADDHHMLREGFKALLGKQPGMSLVAEAGNGTELLQLVEQHSPDIVITDIRMPVLDGIEACRTISRRYPHIGVIALSGFDEHYLVADMIAAGAKGYLLKNADKSELIKAIKTVSEGGTYFEAHMANNLEVLLKESPQRHYKIRSKVEFTPRELNIIELCCREYTNKEIAAILQLSTRTVEAHKDRMQDKIEAKNMVGVIIYAIRNNLVRVATD